MSGLARWAAAITPPEQLGLRRRATARRALPDVAHHSLGALATAAQTPDQPGFTIPDALDARFLVRMDSWTPGIISAIGGHWVAAGDQRSWFLGLYPNGNLHVRYSPNGVTSVQVNSTAATEFTPGTTHWLRFTYVPDRGDGQREVRFYTSSDGESWTQLGTPVASAANAAPLFDTSAFMAVGYAGGIGVGEDVRAVLGMWVRRGIDGEVVASPDFRSIDPSATELIDRQGNPWAIPAGTLRRLVGPPFRASTSPAPTLRAVVGPASAPVLQAFITAVPDQGVAMTTTEPMQPEPEPEVPDAEPVEPAPDTEPVPGEVPDEGDHPEPDETA